MLGTRQSANFMGQSLHDKLIHFPFSLMINIFLHPWWLKNHTVQLIKMFKNNFLHCTVTKMSLCNTELGIKQNAWPSLMNWCFEWMYVHTDRICYITPDISLESAEDMLVIFSYTLAFYRHRGPRILMAELNKENINTKHNYYQNIVFLHPELFFSTSNAACI